VSATELIVARNKQQRNDSELPNVSLNLRTSSHRRNRADVFTDTLSKSCDSDRTA
jgi:hypothetical protein